MEAHSGAAPPLPRSLVHSKVTNRVSGLCLLELDASGGGVIRIQVGVDSLVLNHG